MKCLLTVSLITLALAGTASADQYFVGGATAYSNWAKALWSTEYTIDWDDVDLGTSVYTTIEEDRYATMAGSPNLSVVPGGNFPNREVGLYVGAPASGFFKSDFVPVSPANVFAPYPKDSPEGILTITFDAPAYAIGVWFLDVEGDYATTGITVNGTNSRFTSNQTDNSQSFMGIISTTSFTSAQIHMASGKVANNGVGIDDLNYALVPLPAAALVGLFGMGVTALKLRKYV